MSIISNPCIRCGKQRIDGETYEKEMITLFGKTTVTVTDTVCPDPSCQKIVMEELEVKRLKKESMSQEREERMKKFRENKQQVKKNIA